MAQSVSAKKRIRQNLAARERNRAARSRLRTVIKKAREAVATKPRDESTAQACRLAASALDRAARRGLLKKNTADRIKSRLAAQRNRSN